MKQKIDLITGKDSELLDSKYEVLSQFYKAFNSKDIDLMTKNWSHSESICMNNPIGGIRKGWGEISAGYKKIFASEHSVYVEFYDFQFITADTMFVANGRERGTLKYTGGTLDLRIRTTRIFKLEGAVWRQHLHHGSIDEPLLLKEYQKIILNK